MTHSIRGTLALVAAALAGLAAFCGSAQAVSAVVTGPQEVVYDYTTMRCDDIDISDGPVQAFRDSTGRIQMLTPNGQGRRLVGPGLRPPHARLHRAPADRVGPRIRLTTTTRT